MLRITTFFIVCLTAAATQAARVDFEIYRNINSIATAGLDVWVNITESANEFAFTFHNDSTATSSLSINYFESTLDAYIDFNSASITESAGSDFGPLATLNPPPANTTIGWVTTGAGFRSEGVTDAEKIANGLNTSGESVTIHFDKVNNATLQDLLSTIHSSARIAIHLRGLNNDDSPLDLISLPVPEPAVIAILFSAAIALTYRRRAN